MAADPFIGVAGAFGFVADVGGGCFAAAALAATAESSCSRFLPRGASPVPAGAGIGGRLPVWATMGLGVPTRAGTGVDTACVAAGVGALVDAAGVGAAAERGNGMPALANRFSSFCIRGEYTS